MVASLGRSQQSFSIRYQDQLNEQALPVIECIDGRSADIHVWARLICSLNLFTDKRSHALPVERR